MLMPVGSYRIDVDISGKDKKRADHLSTQAATALGRYLEKILSGGTFYGAEHIAEVLRPRLASALNGFRLPKGYRIVQARISLFTLPAHNQHRDSLITTITIGR